MKCPNCSFENADGSKQCKICGYDLPIKTIANKKRFAEDDNDAELDSALKSLFGLDENTSLEDDSLEEDPLDVAAVERMLHKKRQPVYDQPVAPPPIPEKKPTKSSSKKAEDNDVPQYSLKVIFIVIALLIILLIVFKSGLIKLPWKYQSDQTPSQAVTIEETIESTESTTELVINLGAEAQFVPVNAFFDYLPEFVNKGNLNILTLFKSSQEALDVLTTFASVGNIESIISANLIASEMNDADATFTVDTVMNRVIDSKPTQILATWDFHIILDGSNWYIDSLGVSSENYTGETTSETTTQANTTEVIQETTKEVVQTTTASTTEATTAPAPFDYSGFISSGSFTGGKASSGQDVGSARYGNHNDFDRIAFDIYKWNGSAPQDTVEEITSYTASISPDGKKITIILTGAMDAYASMNAIDFTVSPNIASVKYSLSGPNESVQIDISLKNACQFKVFSLKSPARLVVDIASK